MDVFRCCSFLIISLQCVLKGSSILATLPGCRLQSFGLASQGHGFCFDGFRFGGSGFRV